MAFSEEEIKFFKIEKKNFSFRRNRFRERCSCSQMAFAVILHFKKGISFDKSLAGTQ